MNAQRTRRPGCSMPYLFPEGAKSRTARATHIADPAASRALMRAPIGAPPRQRKQRLGVHDNLKPNKRQGLDEFQVQAAYQSQRGLCAVGGEPLDPATMVVDHCHQCAEAHGHDPKRGCRHCFRGLICPRHNSALGWLGDDAQALRRAADYAAHGRHG